MSSRVLPPGDPQPVSLPTWRQAAVGRGPRQPRRRAAITRADRPDATKCEQRVARGARSGNEGRGSRRTSRAAAELQPVMERLARSIEEMAGLRARFRREAEADLIALSIAIARRVLRREMALDPGALHGLVLGALEKLQGQEIRRVKVHPSQPRR